MEVDMKNEPGKIKEGGQLDSGVRCPSGGVSVDSYLASCCPLSAAGDVVGDGLREQHGFLRDQAQLGPQPLDVQILFALGRREGGEGRGQWVNTTL